MIQLVKGNDAPIEWRVSLNGQPLDLTGKAVTLYVINSRGPFQLKDFKVEGHVVTCTYYGADQTRFGAHSLILRLNEGLPEMSTVAVKDVLELVEWSKEQGGENGGPVKVTPIILEADVAVGHSGGDIDLSDYLTKEEFNEASERFASADRVQELSENVTELSAEVSGLSEKVDALGEGAEQEVFWATEGITDASKGTTYDEILAAHNAGKVVKCLYQKIIFDLRYVTNILYFAANVNNNLYYLKCPQSNKWQYSTENTEHKLETLDNGNAQITIAGKTAEVATPQYVQQEIANVGGGASNEWKCVAERRFLEGEDNIIFTSYADGTSLLAKEAIIEVINDQKAEAIITGYVRIQSTSNKNRCSFGIINYETNAMPDGGICVQEMRIETSPYFFTKAFVAQNMKNSIAQTTPVLEQIGHNPQIFEDIVSIELATNVRLTSAAPLVKIYAR